MVGGPERSKLHQVGRRWAQGRLVVAMGRISAWDVVVVSVGGPQGAWSVLAVRAMPSMVGGRWPQVVGTRPYRQVVGAGPVGSRHGSYQ